MVLIALITITTLHDTTQPDASDAESIHPNVLVKRDVEIINGGILFMNDTYTLSAPSGTELIVSEFWTGHHSSFIYERFSAEMWQEGTWVPMEHSEQTYDFFRGHMIEPLSPITLNDRASLILRTSYLFVNRVSKKANIFEARIPVYPALPYNISSFELSIVLPIDAEYDNVSSPLNFTQSKVERNWKVDHESIEIGPYANVNATISYIPSPEDEYLLDCERLERKIIVDRGSLRVEDSYKLINMGDRINQFHLRLPVEASNIKARDGIGTIEVVTTEAMEQADRIDAYVTPRPGFRSLDRWSFTVAYNMPRKDFVTRTDGGTTLRYPNNDFPHYVRDLSTIVTQPEGETYSLKYGARLPSERPEIVVDLPPASIMPFVRPIASLLLLAGLVGAVMALKKRRRPPVEIKPVEVEIPKLSNFIGMQRERITLLKEVGELELKLEEEKIDRDRFNQRMAEINRRLGELKRNLRQLGRTLEEEDPSLRDRLRELRRTQEEIDRTREDLRNLEVRLRARRISRRDYERRRKDRLRRQSQAIRRMEQAVSSLVVEG